MATGWDQHREGPPLAFALGCVPRDTVRSDRDFAGGENKCGGMGTRNCKDQAFLGQERAAQGPARLLGIKMFVSL